jgi:6-phosphogluconate dehydrogenase
MQLGMIGLGRMGSNMVRRLMRAGHSCVVYDRSAEAVGALAGEGAAGAASLDEFVAALAPPRTAWVMVPAGAPTEGVVNDLAARLAAGDAIVDGGNSYFKDDVRRAAALRERSIDYLDVGTSGGVWGLERGYCLMIGGPTAAFARLEPIFRALAPGRGEISPVPGREGRASSASDGYLHCGPSGAGHFVKMIHNGIEYGLMQAYAEGFDILRNAGQESLPAGERYDLDLRDIAELWRRGSVVTSWLLDLTAAALAKSPALEEYEGVVQDSGEGRWTIQAAIDEAVPADVLAASLFTRFRSRRAHTFAEQVLSAMRMGFGGHRETPGPKKG